MRFWVLPRGPMMRPMKLVPGYSFCGIHTFFHFLAGLRHARPLNFGMGDSDVAGGGIGGWAQMRGVVPEPRPFRMYALVGCVPADEVIS